MYFSVSAYSSTWMITTLCEISNWYVEFGCYYMKWFKSCFLDLVQL